MYIPYAENQTRILSMPAIPGVIGKGAPGTPIVLILQEDPKAARLVQVVLHVLIPDY